MGQREYGKEIELGIGRGENARSFRDFLGFIGSIDWETREFKMVRMDG